MPGVVLTDASFDANIGRIFLGVNENGGMNIEYDAVRLLTPLCCQGPTVACF